MSKYALSEHQAEKLNVKGDKKIVSSQGLSDKESAVVATMRMRLTIEQSLKYMNDVGYNISQSTYSRIKRKIQSAKFQRLYHIAKIGFEDQHLDRIDNCELILKLMWENYHDCKDPFKRVIILEKLANVQPILSSYYDITRAVMKATTQCTCAACQRHRWDLTNQVQADIDKNNNCRDNDIDTDKE